MRPRLNVNIDPTIAKNAALRALSRKPRSAEFSDLHWKEQDTRAKKPRGKPFTPGVSGNPSGKTKDGLTSKQQLSARKQSIEARRKLIAESGLTPLEFLLSVVRDPFCHMDYRIDASKAAAPYVHRKMPIAIEGGDPTRPIVFEASALTMLAPSEKMLLLTLVEKMALGMQQPSSKKPWEKIIEGVARQEAESDDEESEHKGNGEDTEPVPVEERADD